MSNRKQIMATVRAQRKQIRAAMIPAGMMITSMVGSYLLPTTYHKTKPTDQIRGKVRGRTNG